MATEGLKLSNQVPPPAKSELARKIREFDKFAQESAALRDRIEYELKLTPLRKSFLEQWLATNNMQEARKHELESERSSLTRMSRNMSYAAIALQMFGLMLILAKDLAKESEVKQV